MRMLGLVLVIGGALASEADVSAFGRCGRPSRCYSFGQSNCYSNCSPCYTPPCTDAGSGNMGNQDGDHADSKSTGPDNKGQIHCICAFDTNDESLGEILKLDTNLMSRWLQTTIPTKRLANGKITLLTGSEATKDNVIKACNDLVVAENDVVFVYLGCHGATDMDTKEHFVRFHDKQLLYRNEIFKALESNKDKLRLTILVTDSCGDIQKIEPPTQVRVLPKKVDWNECKFKTLLMTTKGVVDITASQPGEFAWFAGGKGAGNMQPGGLFTAKFIEVCSEKPVGKVTWTSVFGEIQTAVEKSYGEYRKSFTDYLLKEAGAGDPRIDMLNKQTSQKPYAFQLPSPDVTQAPASERDQATAKHAVPTRIIVDLPAGATLKMNDHATISVGARRFFTTPPLTAGYTYSYQLEAALELPGQVQTLRRTIEFVPGQIVTVEMQFPQTNEQPVGSLSD